MTTASQTPGEPAEIDALADLATREHLAGRLAEAALAYRKILALRPNIAEVYSNLGNVLKDQGNLDEAAAHYERAVAIKPGLFAAYNNLGNILRQQGKLDMAAARYRQAIALKPDLAEAHRSLGAVLRTQGKLDAAVAHYERALEFQPGHFGALFELGSLLRTLGKLDLAVARLEQAIVVRPQHAQTYYTLGSVLKQQGKLERALSCYDQALALRPDYAEVLYDRTDLKTFHPGDPDIAALEALAASTGRLPESEMPRIHFALGKALEDTGQYQRAFEHLLQGNALKRREIHYDETGCHRGFRMIVEAFDSSLFDRFATAGDPSSTPIFVLGMPRSGSTLIEQILASHPQVQAAGELLNLNRTIQVVPDAQGQPVPFPAYVRGLDGDAWRRLGQAYVASLPPLAEGKTRITDKMPMNFAYVGLIRLILPNARIIHTMRDPVDTCVSCFSRFFTSGVKFTYDLGELGRYYRGYYELMAHWRKVLPAGAMLDVSYENVVDNLEEQARRLIDYCGLPWDDRCLSFHETDRSIATPSNVQVRRSLYRSSIERWRRYETYLEPLLAELAPCRAS